MMKNKLAMGIILFILGFAIGIIFTYLMVLEQDSPYLGDTERLSDVIAALTVMATWRYDKLEPDDWHKFIGKPPKSADSWKEVFDEHPEFFLFLPPPEDKASENKVHKVSLAWRRAQELSVDPNTGQEIPEVELYDQKIWPEQRRKKVLLRRPLTAEQTTALIEIANNMQTQAIARRAELRWWIPMVFGLLGILVGGLLRREVIKTQQG